MTYAGNCLRMCLALYQLSKTMKHVDTRIMNKAIRVDLKYGEIEAQGNEKLGCWANNGPVQ
jgi:hypothetical protein